MREAIRILQGGLALGALLLASVAGGDDRAFLADCARELRLSHAECTAWEKSVLPLELPASEGNTYANRRDAALLGFKFFFDSRFSRSGSGVSCSTCHIPEHAFAEKRPFSKGVATVSRNAPSLFNAARKHRFFLDGRADALWKQPLITMEMPEEMDFTRLEAAHLIARIYKADYEKVFGPLPPLEDGARFPARGKAGDPAFDAMAEDDRKEIDRVAVNLGKAFEAYVRMLAAGRSLVDSYLLGDPDALKAHEKRGMRIFTRLGCVKCHSGPTFTDEMPHDLGVPNWAGAKADLGPFLTPSLRNLTRTFPYMHNGNLSTLREAVEFHMKPRRGGDPLLKAAQVKARDLDDLLTFLAALDGRPPGLPWSYWIGK